MCDGLPSELHASIQHRLQCRYLLQTSISSSSALSIVSRTACDTSPPEVSDTSFNLRLSILTATKAGKADSCFCQRLARYRHGTPCTCSDQHSLPTVDRCTERTNQIRPAQMCAVNCSLCARSCHSQRTQQSKMTQAGTVGTVE